MNEVVRRVDLGGGARLVIRRTAAADRDLLHQLYEGLAEEDRYRRFFSPFDPDEEFLDHLVTANEHGAHQLIAVVERDGEPDEPVGEAGAWRRPNGNAELGITVKSTNRGWLGPYLLDALVELTAAAGIPNLEAEVLMTNRRMLALLKPRGYAAVGHDGYRSARLAISTSGRTPGWAPDDDRPRLLIEAPAGRWDGEETAGASGVQVMVCPGPRARANRTCPELAGETCPLAAGADAIVLHLGTDLDARLGAAHAARDAGVPVCVHPAGENVHDVATNAARLATEHHEH